MDTNKIIDDNTPIEMMTFGELKAVLMPLMGISTTVTNTERKYGYGLRGIAQTFGCSIPTAQRIKNSGKIDGALMQCGRKIVIDVEKALELSCKSKLLNILENEKDEQND